MPSEVSDAGANSNRDPTVEELQRRLAEARDQQSATREILGVMAISPSDAQPVFDAIARSARRLCGGFRSAVWLRRHAYSQHCARQLERRRLGRTGACLPTPAQSRDTGG